MCIVGHKLFVSFERGLLENAGTMVGQRSLQWDLGMIEPGLCLRVGPTSDANSVLEFVMDPTQDRGDRYSTEEPSTGNFRFQYSNNIPNHVNSNGIC